MEKQLFVRLLLLTLLKGVWPLEPKVLHVRAGEMVVLQCPYFRRVSDGDVKVLWTSHTSQEMNVTSNMSTSAEQSHVDVLIHGRSLIILRASVNHQGNYSCSRGNASSRFWFRLTVYTTQSREHEEKNQNHLTCYMQQSCTMKCPVVILPPVNITSNGIIWNKKGESSPRDGIFSRVDEKHRGLYNCTRLYLYQGQTYSMTFTVSLDIQPSSKILWPHKDDVLAVELDSPVVINCTAFVTSKFDDVFWLSGESFVETNSSLPFFYNYTRGKNADKNKVTASLVFKKVSEEDLSRSYTCKLESAHQPSSFVTITLTQKARPFSLSLTLCIVAIAAVIVITILGAMIVSHGCSCRKGSVNLHRGEQDSSVCNPLSGSSSII
uniref:Uncharacterized LOC103365197 n=1 Tax=Stegastes partitus TaxID=144197 RepID=A0A3B5AHJ4_9TELE